MVPATPTAVSAADLTTVFAAEGIATLSSMSATLPVEAVHGPVIMRFTTDQVRAMAGEASAGSGLRGGALDAAHPVPAGTPPLSYLLAAWVATGRSAGAAEIRWLMGTQDWSAAPRLTFPLVALPLFNRRRDRRRPRR
jgi:hypothetical protein